VRQCESCRAHYDTLFGFEAGYDGGKAEVERIGEAVFAKLGAEEKRGWKGVFAFTWPFPTVAVGLAAVLAVVVLVRNSGDDFAPRGGPSLVGPELLATCFVDRGQGPEVVQSLTEVQPYPVCPRGGRIALAYRGARDGDSIAVFAVRGNEASQLIPAEGQSAPRLTSGGETRLLAGSLAIAQEASEGEVKLVALFGPSPSLQQLQSLLAAEAGGSEDGVVMRQVAYRLEGAPEQPVVPSP